MRSIRGFQRVVGKRQIQSHKCLIDVLLSVAIIFHRRVYARLFSQWNLVSVVSIGIGSNTAPHSLLDTFPAPLVLRVMIVVSQ